VVCAAAGAVFDVDILSLLSNLVCASPTPGGGERAGC
jgi:hypothetical protein